jgi:hypothetical protein
MCRGLFAVAWMLVPASCLVSFEDYPVGNDGGTAGSAGGAGFPDASLGGSAGSGGSGAASGNSGTGGGPLDASNE